MYLQSGCIVVVIYDNCGHRFVRSSVFIFLNKNCLELAQSKDARKAVVSMGLASERCCLHGHLKPHPLACTASFFLVHRMHDLYLSTLFCLITHFINFNLLFTCFTASTVFLGARCLDSCLSTC